VDKESAENKSKLFIAKKLLLWYKKGILTKILQIFINIKTFVETIKIIFIIPFYKIVELFLVGTR